MSDNRLHPAVESMFSPLPALDPHRLPTRPALRIRDAAGAWGLVQTIQRGEGHAIALDVQMVSRRMRVGGIERWDVSNLDVWLVGLAVLIAPSGREAAIQPYALRGDEPGVRLALAALMKVPVPVIMHDAKNKLIGLRAAGVEVARDRLFDTKIAASCMELGRYHFAARHQGDVAGKTTLDHERRATADAHFSLVGQCLLHRLGPPAGEAALDQGAGIDEDVPPMLPRNMLLASLPFRAERALRLALAQAPGITEQRLWWHLREVEFPFTEANARIEATGVRVSMSGVAAIESAADGAIRRMEAGLLEAGISRPFDKHAVVAWLPRVGLESLLALFMEDGEVVLDDARLQAVEDRHPAIRLLRRLRKFKRLLAECVRLRGLQGRDGRVHPVHRQLGAATGRNTCVTPNVAGIGRLFRPMIVPDEGRRLFEADFCQIEVGVAAAEHGDSDLIAAFNSSDVYTAVERRFHWHELTPEEREMSLADLKARRRRQRDQMKIVVLGILYNMGDAALASMLGVTVPAARAMRERFFEAFPRVKAGMEADRRRGALVGFAQIVSGLRRWLPEAPGAAMRAGNWMMNTPIQGGACVVFKRAVVALDHAFEGTKARIVLPIHDSVLVECSAEELPWATETTKRLMVAAMRDIYPALTPKIEINAIDPSCWNKDGASDSIQRFLADPLA